MIFLKQSTASQEVPLGYFVDSTDGNTEETGLSIANTDIKVWKTGATTLANKNSGGATHISNGIYYAVLDATDTDTLGPLVIFVHVSGALTVRLECCVLAENVYDSLVGATDKLDVNTAEITAAVTVTTNNDKTGYGLAANAITASVIAADAVTEIQSGLSTLTAADVNSEVVDVLSVDTFAEPGSGAPGASISLASKIGYLYKAFRNKVTQTSTEYKLYADDEATVHQKATVADDGTTFTRGEVGGP